MKLHTDNLLIRIGATVMGTGYAAFGGYAVAVSSEAPTAELADRALWMGITFLIAAVLAVGVSWLVADLSNIWCVAPRKTPQKRLPSDPD